MNITSHPIIRQFTTSIRDHLRVPLFASAYTLITNQVLTAGLGYLYWVLAARLYPVETVGENSALLSTILLLSSLSELSFKAATTRFVPRAGKRTPQLLVTMFGITLVVSFAVSLFLVTLGKHFSLTAGLLQDIHIWPGWLVLAPMIWTVFYIQDGILTGMRQTKWVVIKNTSHSIIKIILLVACLWMANEYGIVVSWFIAVPILVVVLYFLIFIRFMPGHVTKDTSQTKPVTFREAIKSTGGDYIGVILSEVGVRILPLLVLSLLSEEATAYYYQAWTVANPIYLIATNMAAAFTVEAASDMVKIMENSRRILQQMARLILPAVIGLWLVTPLILRVFGRNYAIEGTALLRWLILAAIPLSVNVWFLSYSRVMSDAKAIILVQAATSAITLATSYLWLPVYGISGVGMSYFLAQTVVAALVLVKTGPKLLRKNSKVEERVDRNHLLRRADWRFLLSIERAQKSICFSDGVLKRAVEPISDIQVGRQTTPANDCDLAVAVNPDLSTLKEAYSFLNQGGMFYSEWSAWRKGGAEGIRLRLKTAGFTDVEIFWTYPGPERPSFWLPLQTSLAPYRYLANQLIPGHGRLQQAIKDIFAGALSFWLRTGIVPELSVVAYKSRYHSPNSFELARTEWLQSRAKGLDKELSYFMQTGGSQTTNKVIFLVFASSDPSPLWIVKLPRIREDAQTIKREVDILRELSLSMGNQPDAVSLPEIVYDGEINGMQVSCQTALVGKQIQELLRPDNFRSFALQMTSCQVKLARQGNKAHQSSIQPLIEKVSADLNVLAGSQLSPEEIAQTRDIIKVLSPAPSVYVHNDFSPWNMLLTEDGLGVFDWTDASRSGPPLFDLVYGLAYLAFSLENTWNSSSISATYNKLLEPQSSLGCIFEECLDLYANQVGLQHSLIPPLRLLTWVLHRNFEYQNSLTESNEKTRFDEQSNGICVALWKAELHLQTGIGIGDQNDK